MGILISWGYLFVGDIYWGYLLGTFVGDIYLLGIFIGNLSREHLLGIIILRIFIGKGPYGRARFIIGGEVIMMRLGKMGTETVRERH